MNKPFPADTVQILDISVPVFEGMVTFPGDPGIRVETVLSMDQGGVANVCCLSIGSQTGTHFDTPHHILNNGITIEQLSLKACYGPAWVAEVPETVQAINAEVLASLNIPPCERLLLKTRNSRFWEEYPNIFQTDYAALTEDGARFIANRQIRLAAIDYLSIELFNTPGLPAHHVLLQNDILILEGINLQAVSPGWYTLAAFPVNYKGLDGAPARAVLLSYLNKI